MLSENSLKEATLQDKLEKIMHKVDEAFKASKDKADSVHKKDAEIERVSFFD